jgi:hypothetical protein
VQCSAAPDNNSINIKQVTKMKTYSFAEISAIESVEERIAYLNECDNVSIINGKVVNIKLRDPNTDKIAVFIRLNKNVPQYMNVGTADVPEYALGECRNIYTSIYSLDAVLKGMGELIASKLLNTKRSPDLALTRIFGGATIMAAGIHYKKGDVFCNPFGNELSTTVVHHDMVKYYIYNAKLNIKVMNELHHIADVEMIRDLMKEESGRDVNTDTFAE